jgi:hypothetical protein
MRSILRRALLSAGALALLSAGREGGADEPRPGMEGYRRSWHPVAPGQPAAQPPPVAPAPPPQVPPYVAPPPYVPPAPPPYVPPAPAPYAPPAYVPSPAPPTWQSPGARELPPYAAPVPVPVAERTLRIAPRGRVWHAIPEGNFLHITLGSEPNTATDVKTDDDLDLEAGLAWEAGIEAVFRRHRLRASYEALHFEGENRLEDAIVFHGDVYPAGFVVESELDLSFWKFGWDYRLAGVTGSEVRAGLSGWIWTFDASVEGGPAGKSSRGFTHVYPLATVEAETRLGALALGASLAGGILADDRYVVDAEAHAGVRIGRHVEIDLGYRFLNFAFHEATNVGDLVFHGPFLQVSFDL